MYRSPNPAMFLYFIGMLILVLWMFNGLSDKKLLHNFETFAIDIPSIVDIETVSAEIYGLYSVSNGSALDHDALMTALESKKETVGLCKTYTVSDMSLKSFVEDVAKTKGDYSQLLHKYVSFPMAIAYNVESNSILYYTVEKPWELKPNLFQDPAYLNPFPDGKVYVP